MYKRQPLSLDAVRKLSFFEGKGLLWWRSKKTRWLRERLRQTRSVNRFDSKFYGKNVYYRPSKPPFTISLRSSARERRRFLKFWRRQKRRWG